MIKYLILHHFDILKSQIGLLEACVRAEEAKNAEEATAQAERAKANTIFMVAEAGQAKMSAVKETEQATAHAERAKANTIFMVAEAEQAKMSAIKETEQANKDVVKAAKETKQALAEVRKYRNCAEQAKAKEEAEKVKCVDNITSNEAIMDSPFKEDLNGYKQACCAGCRRRPFPMKLHQ